MMPRNGSHPAEAGGVTGTPVRGGAWLGVSGRIEKTLEKRKETIIADENYGEIADRKKHGGRKRCGVNLRGINDCERWDISATHRLERLVVVAKGLNDQGVRRKNPSGLDEVRISDGCQGDDSKSKYSRK